MLDVTHYWYRSALHPLTLLLVPFSWLFHSCSLLRKWLYRIGILKTYHFDVPVIIVGNITIGGTGKTPLVIWLANFLREQGYSPGIVTRGYGGMHHKAPCVVQETSTASEVGDEAVLLTRHANCPVVIGADRVAAVKALLHQFNCDIVISDDGLQHYRLGRAIEIAVVDGARRFGNNHLLPAGPLRESIERLNSVDYVIVNEGNANDDFTFRLKPCELIAIANQSKVALAELPNKKVHAIAGIGHPQRFFNTLKNNGLEVIPHVFPDHYVFRAQDIFFNDDLPVVMTEKDAVKCQHLVDDKHWCLAVIAEVDDVFKQKLLKQLQTLEVGDEHKKNFAKHSHDAGACIQRDDVCE